MSRWIQSPSRMTKQALADANTVSFDEIMADTITGNVLHCASPEMYFMWIEEMHENDMDVDIETIWS